MMVPGILAASHAADAQRQSNIVEEYLRLWERKYSHWLSTPGTARPIPEVVENRLGILLVRMPIPALGFSLWGFKAQDELDRFIHALPQLMNATVIRVGRT